MYKCLYKMVLIKICFFIFVLHQTYGLPSEVEYVPFPATRSCLLCVCDASSSCDTAYHCDDVCGPFRITEAYWIDSGRPTVNRESPESPTAFDHCAHDLYCAGLAVQGYMSRYHQDCNKDGKIDCDDYVMIHKFGGFGCPGGHLPEAYKQRYLKCQNLARYWF